MLLPFFVSAYTYPDEAHDTRECVILLHGIFTTGMRMSRLHRRLHKEGYTVVSISYPTRAIRMRAIAEHIEPMIAGYRARHSRMHIVGYSMGGLIARLYLARQDAVVVDSLVCIGTPNKGTEFIDLIRQMSWIKRLFAFVGGPSGNELGSAREADSVVHELGTNAPAGVATGIIAGRARWSPASKLPQPHDGYVPVENCTLDGMQDCMIVPYGHIHLPFRREVTNAVVTFLQTRSFDAEKKEIYKKTDHGSKKEKRI